MSPLFCNLSVGHWIRPKIDIKEKVITNERTRRIKEIKDDNIEIKRDYYAVVFFFIHTNWEIISH
jgi:hypothetical protein